MQTSKPERKRWVDRYRTYAAGGVPTGRKQIRREIIRIRRCEKKEDEDIIMRHNRHG